MNLTIGRKIAFGFACALVALFAVGLTVYLLLQELNGDASLVTHTVEVQQRIQGLLSGLLQEESSARGYTLSPNPQFETLAKDAQAQITSNLRALRFLTQDNPHQQKRLDQLEPLITQRMNALQKLMDERSTGTTNEADQIALVNNGLETMGEMRGIMDAMMDEETGLLKQRQASAADKEGATYVAVIGGTLASAVFTVTAALLVSRSITRPLRILNEGAARIGAGDYGYRVNVRSRDEVGELAGVFNHMAGQVEERQRIQLEQDWLKTSLARFAMLFQGRRNPAFVSQAILAELATLVEARHSVLYTPEHDGTSVVLKPQAAYAADGVPAEVHPGQGLVGQCLVDKQRVLLTEVPPDYLKVNSALGATQPKNVLVQPALFEGELKGVLELASLTACTPLQLEFLAQLSDSIGTVLNTIEGAVRTEQLLEQSQALTENLRVQQVELSVKNEQLESQASRLRASEVQLQEQQEELQQTNEELEQANEEMQQTNEEMEEKVNLLAAQKKELERANRDIDIARKEVQEQAEKVALASKYKSDFLASMSHELRTPLNSLLILSKILSDNGESNLSEKQVQYARTIYSSGNDLLELINEILDLSRIESGKVEVEPATTALTDIRDFVESNFRHIAESKHLELAVELDPALPATIETDVRRVEQVLKNLLSNAFKFTEHGSVRFRAAPATSGWDPQVKTLNTAAQVIALAVSDTGIGIPADKQEAVFEAFQQADAGTARKYGGTGLGLSISRELAELLGGSIKLESTPGQGSTFTLFLPSVLTASAPGPVAAPAAPVAARIPRDRRLAAATPTSEAADGEAPSNDSDGIADDRTALKAGDRLLLIIEDDRNFANILMELAREKRFKVVVARNAAQGLAWARHVKPSAITLDLHLPDNDGWVVLDQLKHDPKTRHIPIHIISVDEERERSLRLGAVSYIQKPVTQETVERALNQTIEFINRPLKRLLIIEDDDTQRQSVVELIGNGDVKTTAVGTAAAAFAALDAEKFDCVVLDLGLPDKPGIELIREIHTRYGADAPPVIVYTGKELTRQEETELRMIAESIVIKNVRSPERLLDETALFLHRVQAALPERKRQMIEQGQKVESVLANRRVLVVDDDVRNIFAITSALEGSQMNVAYAESGQAALDYLQEHPDIEVVLMDVMMPEMDGFETIRRIRRMDQFKKLPIISVTAKAMKGDREKCLEAGASDYITKPVDMEQLRSLLRVWLYR